MDNVQNILPDVKLRFNIEHPTVEDCYTYGYECAKASLGEEENPFETGTTQSDQWLDGWWDGFYGEEPVLTLEVLESEVIPSSQPVSLTVKAANDGSFHQYCMGLMTRIFEVTGALAASALIGYQVIDLVA